MRRYLMSAAMMSPTTTRGRMTTARRMSHSMPPGRPAITGYINRTLSARDVIRGLEDRVLLSSPRGAGRLTTVSDRGRTEDGQRIERREPLALRRANVDPYPY